MIYFPFCSMTFSIFLATSWFHAHRTSGLYRQKTEPHSEKIFDWNKENDLFEQLSLI